MSRYGPAALLLLVGGAVLRISLFSALYLRYVQSGLRPYLVAAGVSLALLGVAAAVRARRHPPEEDPAPRHGHHHTHPNGPRLAWLLALPAAALLLFPPPALGSYSAARDQTRSDAQSVGRFPALPAGDPVTLTVSRFGSRAVYDSGRSLRGRTVRLTGFVTRDDDGWYVTRLLVSCCAADATTTAVRIRGATGPATDTWVTVTGVWHPTGAPGSRAAWPPVLDAGEVRPVPQPKDPYERR
ncbi:TIGR03943 family putative permease subunit [Streptomyces ardesiacus]